jgi:cell division protein ZapA (FtsZ GTPase activity inhibitor)
MATMPKEQAIRDLKNSSVRVEIFDQAYNLRGSDADYILKLAEYVDGKMRAVAEATSTVDTMRLAVLAALNIADEYHVLKRWCSGRSLGRGATKKVKTNVPRATYVRSSSVPFAASILINQQTNCHLFSCCLLRIAT